MVSGLMVAGGCGRQEAVPTPAPTPGVSTEAVKEPAPAAETQIAQKLCPVMGQPINKEFYVDYQGRRIYFCCQMCVDTFKKDPEKYVKKVDEQLQAKPGA